MINKDTKLFVSVSQFPGDFGASLYNAAFEHLGYNAIYKPLKCETVSQFVDIVRYAKNYSISGISVSMPFKKVAVSLGTAGDDEVLEIGNANTLVFDKNPAPKAYNTDWCGFEDVNKNILRSVCSATIVGNGAVAESIKYVLIKYGISYHVFNSRHTLRNAPFEYSDFLINCSPIGMENIEDRLFKEEFVKPFKYVFDVVVSKQPTNLIKAAEKLGKPCVVGWEMSLEQLCYQWEHYTILAPPREVFRKVLKESGYEN